MESLDFIVKVRAHRPSARVAVHHRPHACLAPLRPTPQPSTQFARDSIRLIKRCTKPDRSGTRTAQAPWNSREMPHLSHRAAPAAPRRVFRPACLSVRPSRPSEFTKIALATSFGFAIMGFIGFFVKLIFIPINNIIVGMN
jgi:protein transport protein SEC61 subunit gamma-like protein